MLFANVYFRFTFALFNFTDANIRHIACKTKLFHAKLRINFALLIFIVDYE